MGKSHKFSFPIPGRKNVVNEHDLPNRSATQFSKAQRVLGAEAATFNVCPSAVGIPQKECAVGFLSSLSTHDTIGSFGSRGEPHVEAIPVLKGKASSILGIFKDQHDGKKSVPPSKVNSISSCTSSKSWDTRRDEISKTSPSTSLKPPHSRSPDIKSRTDHKQGHLAHIATYIHQNTGPTLIQPPNRATNFNSSFIAELPGNYITSPISGSEVSRQKSELSTLTSNRPISSSSCPVVSNPKAVFSTGKLRDTYSGDLHSSQRSICPPRRPKLRLNNISAPDATDKVANVWTMDHDYVDEKIFAHEDIGTDIPSTSSSDDEGSDSVPVFLRSSRKSFLSNKYNTNVSTPMVEKLFLDIPKFSDLQLSGPWSESGDEHDHYFPIPLPTQEIEPPTIKTQISNSQFETQNTRNPSQMTHQESTSPSIRVDFCRSSLQCDFSTLNLEEEKVTLEPQCYKKSSEDSSLSNKSNITTRHPPVCTKVQKNSRSNSNSTSTCTLSDDGKATSKANTQKTSLFLDTYANNWEDSSIYSLCTDYDSASSATLLKNEPAYHRHSGADTHTELYNNVSPYTALMEVAQIGQVINRAPVREMIKGRRKEDAILVNIR